MGFLSNRRADVLVCSIIVYTVLCAPAYAYLDPASGAAVTSAILGFFAAIAYAARKQFYRIMRLVRGKDALGK